MGHSLIVIKEFTHVEPKLALEQSVRQNSGRTSNNDGTNRLHATIFDETTGSHCWILPNYGFLITAIKGIIVHCQWLVTHYMSLTFVTTCDTVELKKTQIGDHNTRPEGPKNVWQTLSIECRHETYMTYNLHCQLFLTKYMTRATTSGSVTAIA